MAKTKEVETANVAPQTEPRKAGMTRLIYTPSPEAKLHAPGLEPGKPIDVADEAVQDYLDSGAFQKEE